MSNIKQKGYCDQGSTQLKPLETADTIRVRADGVWGEKARVKTQVAPNSSLVELERGRRLRRNRKHLLKTQEHFISAQEEDDREAVVSQDHSSGGARCTIATKQPAMTVETAKPNENSTQ